MKEVLSGVFEMSSVASYKLDKEGVTGTILYFLVDGIYPEWMIIAKPIHHPSSEAVERYTKRQEA